MVISAFTKENREVNICWFINMFTWIGNFDREYAWTNKLVDGNPCIRWSSGCAYVIANERLRMKWLQYEFSRLIYLIKFPIFFSLSNESTNFVRLFHGIQLQYCVNKQTQNVSESERKTIGISINWIAFMWNLFNMNAQKIHCLKVLLRKCLLHLRCTIKLRWIEAALVHMLLSMCLQKQQQQQRVNNQIPFTLFLVLSPMSLSMWNRSAFHAKCICRTDLFIGFCGVA